MSEFKEFLQDAITEAADDATATDVANSLSKSLGRKLAQKGWISGSRGSGIVAMADLGDGRVKEAQSIIKTFLKNIKMSTIMVKGKLPKERGFEYRGFIISVTETSNAVKVIVS